MFPRSVSLAIAGSLLVSVSWAQPRKENHDESLVKPYTLPDPLVFTNGEKVRSPRDRTARRRPEILHLFEENQFGRTPTKKIEPRFQINEIDKHGLGGKAVRKQITMTFAGQSNGPRVAILVYLPANASGPVPVFVGLNFMGNHTVDRDGGIRLPDVWDLKEHTRQKASDTNLGQQASRWQVERVLDRGYGIATAYYGDIEPDFDGSLKMASAICSSSRAMSSSKMTSGAPLVHGPGA